MTLQLGWFSEDFKLLSRFKQLIFEKVAQELSTVKDFGSVQNGLYNIEEEEGPYNWMRIILPHGLSTGHQLIGIFILTRNLSNFNACQIKQVLEFHPYLCL